MPPSGETARFDGDSFVPIGIARPTAPVERSIGAIEGIDLGAVSIQAVLPSRVMAISSLLGGTRIGVPTASVLVSIVASDP